MESDDVTIGERFDGDAVTMGLEDATRVEFLMPPRFSFQRLEVYQVAKAVAQLLIENRFVFIDLPGELHPRLSRAMLDVLAQIAAGSGQSQRAEQRRHYQQACSSASEVMSCVELADLHGSMPSELLDHLSSQLGRINQMLSGMVRRRTACRPTRSTDAQSMLTRPSRDEDARPSARIPSRRDARRPRRRARRSRRR